MRLEGGHAVLAAVKRIGAQANQFRCRELEGRRTFGNVIGICPFEKFVSVLVAYAQTEPVIPTEHRRPQIRSPGADHEASGCGVNGQGMPSSGQ